MYLNNHIHDPLISLQLTQIYHAAITIATPHTAIIIFYEIAILETFLEVVVLVRCSSSCYVAKETVDVGHCPYSLGPEACYKINPVWVVGTVNLGKRNTK